MKKSNTAPYVINSISELHRVLELPPPQHPLVSVIHLDAVPCLLDESIRSVVYNFYSLCIKKDFKGKLRYGQQYYDFDEGIMTAFSPGQVTAAEMSDDGELKGWWLVIHPDFLRNYPLAKTIRNYGFFSYASAEALHLSQKEEEMITALISQIEREYVVTDNYSQDVIVSQIELLLNYCNRFYNRQFITRKSGGSDLLQRLEAILEAHFSPGTDVVLPTVAAIAGQLHVSPHYLSDMLRSLTGQSAQQHIQARVIEQAKELLSTTNLSVGEIAYQLGFGYPQSLNKLFKAKVNLSPLAFRASFN